MSMKIVTGKTGTAHVESADDASFQLGVVGGDYVLPVGNKFAYTLVDNNTITIADGDITIQGYLGRIVPGDTDTATITNGTQGQLRNDLIVARYTKNSGTGYESMAIAVKKGTAVSANPSDPSLTQGNIRSGDLVREVALYRVKLDGLTVESVTALFNVSKSLGDIEDYIVEQGSSGIWKYRKWDSGIAECWGSDYVNATVDFTTEIAGGVYGNTNWSNKLYSFPINLFTSLEYVDCSIASNTYTYSQVASRTTSSIGIRAWNPYSSSPMISYVMMQAKGRWK